jgi:hypothetical protein
MTMLYWLVVWRLSDHDSTRGQLDATASPVVQTRFEQLVIETMVPAILGDSTLETEERTARTDDEGEWSSTEMTWRLPQSSATARAADEMERMTAELAPHATVYRSSPEDNVEVLRIYLGKRLTHHITLQPTLSTLLPPQGEAPALLAIVVTGLGYNGSTDRQIIETEFPLTVAIEPFAPFALRDARDSLQHFKEVIVTASDNGMSDEEITEALSAVPNSTGLLLAPAPSELPHEELSETDHYMVALQASTETPAIRRATNEGVRLITSDLAVRDDGLLRFQHKLRTHSSIVVTLPATSQHLTELLDFVETAPQSLLRPVFLTEILDFRQEAEGY